VHQGERLNGASVTAESRGLKLDAAASSDVLDDGAAAASFA
jgi:hypothetical protein